MKHCKSLTIRLSKFIEPPFGIQAKAKFEFHIHASVREKYQFDQSLFSMSGNVIFPNFNAARIFAQKLNEKHPDRGVRAGHLNAMGLIDEILHYMLRLYEETA